MLENSRKLKRWYLYDNFILSTTTFFPDWPSIRPQKRDFWYHQATIAKNRRWHTLSLGLGWPWVYWETEGPAWSHHELRRQKNRLKSSSVEDDVAQYNASKFQGCLLANSSLWTSLGRQSLLWASSYTTISNLMKNFHLEISNMTLAFISILNLGAYSTE